MTNPTKVCPREPTAEMFIRGTKALAAADGSFARLVWYAMYDAAPAEAAQGEVARVIERLRDEYLGCPAPVTTARVQTLKDAERLIRALAPKAAP